MDPTYKITLNGRSYFVFARMMKSYTTMSESFCHCFISDIQPLEKRWGKIGATGLTLPYCSEFVIEAQTTEPHRPHAVVTGDKVEQILVWLKENMRDEYRIVEGRFVKNRWGDLNENVIMIFTKNTKDEMLLKMVWR